jgi:hypothetical protein
MNRLYGTTLIAINLILVSLLVYQSKARRHAEEKSLNLQSRINDLDTYVFAIKNEERVIGKEVSSILSLVLGEDIHGKAPQNFFTNDKMLLVLFSSSSCQSCVDALTPYWSFFAGLKINTFAVAQGSSISEVNLYGKLNGVTVPLLFDENAKVASELGLPPNAVAVLYINRGKVAIAYISNPNTSVFFRDKIFLERLKLLLD